MLRMHGLEPRCRLHVPGVDCLPTASPVRIHGFPVSSQVKAAPCQPVRSRRATFRPDAREGADIPGGDGPKASLAHDGRHVPIHAAGVNGSQLNGIPLHQRADPVVKAGMASSPTAEASCSGLMP